MNLRVWPDMKMSQVLLQHDSARPHTALCTREAVAIIVWTKNPHPPYSPDFAPSDFHLLGPLKDAFLGCCFVNDGQLKHNVCEGLWCFCKEFKFFMASVWCLMQRWRKCISNEGDFVEKCQLHKGCSHDTYKFQYKSSFWEKKSRKQFYCTAPCSFHTCHICIGAFAALRDCSIETFSSPNVLCILWFSIVISSRSPEIFFHKIVVNFL